MISYTSVLVEKQWKSIEIPRYTAVQSLSRAFPTLKMLTNKAILGRVFQMIDRDHDGMLNEEEFVEGLYEPPG